MYVNGEKINLQEKISLSEFLKRQAYDARRVAVEKNGDIVPQKNFDTEMLDDSDKIEIVHFVGGG
jgi:thiamine biosynthesis protein ThiS